MAKCFIIVLIIILILLNFFYFYFITAKKDNKHSLSIDEIYAMQVDKMKRKINFNQTFTVVDNGNVVFYDSANIKYEDLDTKR